MRSYTHGEQPATDRIAAFDFDWTLVRTKSKYQFSQGPDDYEWLNPLVPEYLKKTYEDGFKIAIFTNQGRNIKKWSIPDAIIQWLKENMPVPFHVVIIIHEYYRKPDPKIFLETFPDFDEKQSFYVGDFAGRLGDLKDSDLKFAENIGIKFYTPEEFFEISDECEVTPEDVGDPVSDPELIIMVGLPGSGKSTVVRKCFPEYVLISGDEVGSAKMLSELKRQFKKHGTDVHGYVVDGTHGTAEKRIAYAEWATANDIKTKVVYVDTDVNTCKRLNIVRHHENPDIPLVPDIAYNAYAKRFEAPRRSEGHTDIVRLVRI